MNSTSLKIDNISNSYEIRKTILFGFVIRLSVLLFMLLFAVKWTEPYFISDDIMYEGLAEKYLRYADSLIDINLISSLSASFLQPFWPWVICILSGLFRTIYASRFLNIILSTLCIKLVYKLVLNISTNKQTALMASKLFAYLPVTVITCCFPIKDIYLTFAVLYCFNLFVELQSNKQIKIRRVIYCAALMVGIYFTRGAVTELMLIFLAVYVIQRFARVRNYFAVIFSLVLFGIIAYIFKDSVMDTFRQKVEDYSDYALIEGGSIVRMRNLTELYKMPLSYFFATLQPMKLNLLALGNSSWWLTVISYLNISIYPVAIGNFFYIFSKKKNLFFWLSTLIMYCAIIFLVLGVFRHYLFLIPIEMINFALYKEQHENNMIFVWIASFFPLLIALI